MMKKIILCVIGLIIILISFLAFSLFTISVKNIKEDTVVTIKEGSGTKQIANTLKSKGIIKSSVAFTNYIKKKNETKNLKPGTYKFSAGEITFDDILNKLIKGEQEESVTVTIPEGYTVEQIAKLLEEKGLTTKENFLECAKTFEIPYDYIEKIDNDYRQLEGFLFPDTYNIPISWKEKEIITLLLKQFDKNWSEEFRNRAKELGFSTREIITIASLIEREAKVEKERPTISSVIHNRLKKGMLLQIDATVQYLLPEQKSRLLYKDLEVDSPYNTYKYAGLPPTPIAAPGLSCIKAALYPEETDYYYYRTKASNNGEHNFSKTFEEHKNNANK